MGRQMFAQILAGGLAALFISAVVIGILLLSPQHVPKLAASVKPDDSKHGLVEQRDSFGLIETQWYFERGVPQGEALQYYSNGSLFRELYYVNGKLEGKVNEYYEFGGLRRPPPESMIPSKIIRMRRAGKPKAVWHYSRGLLEGPYELYDEGGMLRESGEYRNGKKSGRTKKYSKDGVLKSEAYSGGW